MDNITGTAKNWLKDPRDQKKIEVALEEVEKKPVDKVAVNKLVSKMEDACSELDRLYSEKPTKSLSDSAVMLRGAIASMKDNLTNN